MIKVNEIITFTKDEDESFEEVCVFTEMVKMKYFNKL